MICAQVSSQLMRASGVATFCVNVVKHLNELEVRAPLLVETDKDVGSAFVDSAIEIVMLRSWRAIVTKADILHVHGIWQMSSHRAVAYANEYDIPCVLSPHGMLTPWALNHRRLKKQLAMMFYQRKDLRNVVAFHATASSEVDDIRRLGLKQPIIVAPLGVDISKRSSIKRSNSPRLALFVSRIHHKKGLINLVEAWAQIRPNGWKMLLAGPDQEGHVAEVMKRARMLGVDRDFQYIGPVYDQSKEELYRRADLFILPSYSENFGVVVVEALAQGCPVITTKGTPWGELLGDSLTCSSGGIRACEELRTEVPCRAFSVADFGVSTGRCGWWVDIGVDPLAEALQEAMALTDDQRHQMGLNGCALAERKYTWPAVALQMKSAYEWLLTGSDRDRPDCIVI